METTEDWKRTLRELERDGFTMLPVREEPRVEGDHTVITDDIFMDRSGNVMYVMIGYRKNVALLLKITGQDKPIEGFFISLRPGKGLTLPWNGYASSCGRCALGI